MKKKLKVNVFNQISYYTDDKFIPIGGKKCRSYTASSQ